MKLPLFIASSTEGLDVAYALQENLENDAEVTVWEQDVFRPSRVIIEDLERIIADMEFGVFVFSADDLVTMRGEGSPAVRDNVLFELGLFIGHIGRSRAFFVRPKNVELRIPSDLLGITALQFDPHRIDGNLRAALGPAANQIRKAIRARENETPSGALEVNRRPAELETSFLRRRTLLTPVQQMLLANIEKAGVVTLEKLRRHLIEGSVIELHYRLEQLRLLMFVELVNPEAKDALKRKYRLTKQYHKVHSGELRDDDRSDIRLSRKRRLHRGTPNSPLSPKTPETPGTPETPETPETPHTPSSP
jgi:hypothetical protein